MAGWASGIFKSWQPSWLPAQPASLFKPGSQPIQNDAAKVAGWLAVGFIKNIFLGNFNFLKKKTDFSAVFLLFTANVRSRPPGPPAVPGVFSNVTGWTFPQPGSSHLHSHIYCVYKDTISEGPAGQMLHLGPHNVLL